MRSGGRLGVKSRGRRGRPVFWQASFFECRRPASRCAGATAAAYTNPKVRGALPGLGTNCDLRHPRPCHTRCGYIVVHDTSLLNHMHCIDAKEETEALRTCHSMAMVRDRNLTHREQSRLMDGGPSRGDALCGSLEAFA